MDGLFGKVAWASIKESAAGGIVNGAIDADYSVVFNMSPTAVYSNKAFRNEILKALSPKDQTKLYKLIKKSPKFQKKEKFKAIIKKSNNLKEMFDLMDAKETKFNVEEKIAFFKAMIPEKGVNATEDIFVLMQKNNLNSEQIIENIQEQFTKDLPLGALTTILEVTTKDGRRISDVVAEIKKEVSSGKITEREGKKRIQAARKEAMISRSEQKQEGLKSHPNYPIYIRGRAVAVLNETTPFWNVLDSYGEIIDKKLAGLITDRDSYTIDYNGQEARALVETREDGSREIEIKVKGKSVQKISLSSDNTVDSESYINENLGEVKGFKKGKKVSPTLARTAAYSSAQKGASRSEEVKPPVQTQYQRFVSRLSKAFPNVEVVADSVSFDELLADLNARAIVNKNQKVYGAVLNGKLYLNPDLATYNTAIHEFGHIWMNVAKELQPEAYQQGLNLVEDTDYVAQVESSPGYTKIIKQMRAEGATEAEIRAYTLEEALATAIGDKGESFTTAAQKKNFKNWLNELFEFVKKLTGISKLSTDQIQNLNFDEFLNAVVTDLLSENEIFLDAEVSNFSNELQLMIADGVTIEEIIQRGRQGNFSDAAIREVLKGRGFKVEDINKAMEVLIDLETPLPPEFARVEGGVDKATQLFNEVRQAVALFARGTKKRTRRTRMTEAEREARIKELREQNPTLTDLSDSALLRKFPRPAQQQQVEVTKPTMAEVRAEALRLLRENPIFQAQPEQVKLELISSFDRTLNTRANRTVQREITDIRSILKQRKIGAKNLKDAQIMLKNFIRQNLQKSSNYTQADINKIVNSISKVKTVDNFYAEAEKIISLVERQRAKMKKKTLSNILSLAKRKAKAGQTSTRKRRSKGLDPEGQSLMLAIAKAASKLINVKPEVSQKFLTEEQAFLEENESEINRIFNKELLEGEDLTTKERDLLNRQIAFDMIRDVDTMTLEEADALLSTLKDLRSESIQRLKNRRAGRAAEYEAMRAEVSSQIEETNPDLFDEDGNVLSDNEKQARREEIYRLFRERKIPQAIREFVRIFKNTSIPKLITDTVRQKLQNLETLTNLADKAIDGKNAFRDNIYNRLNRMNENHLRGKRRVKSIMNYIAVEAGFENGYEGVKQAMARGFFREAIVNLELTNSKTGKKFTKSFNVDQLLRIYALSLNDVQRAKLEAQGIGPATLEDIKSELGPELVAFADGVVNFFSETYYEEVNAVYSDVNDVNLGYVANYFPTRTERSKVDGKMLDDGNFSGIFSAETAPALKERQDTTGDIKFDASFTGVLENHIDTMEKFKAYAKGVRMMNAFFDIPAVNSLIEELNIKGVMKQLINNSINPNAGVEATGAKTLLDKLLSKYTGFALAFKIMQIPKQATSFVNAYADYSYFPEDSNIPKAVQAMVDPIMFMMDTATLIANLGVEMFTKDGPLSEAREMSATFDERVRQGLEGDVYGLESGSKPFRKIKSAQTGVGRARRAVRSAAGAPTAIGDIGGVMGYLVNYRRNIKNGMSKEEAVEVFNNYNATQQSRRGTERIPLQNSNNALVRTYTMFGSVLFLQMNKVMQASKNITQAASNGKMPRAKDTRELFINLAVANVLFTVMSNIMLLTRGDDDDREKAMIRISEAMTGLNLVYQIPILGVQVEKAELGAKLIQGEDFKPSYGAKFRKDALNPLDIIMLKVMKAMKPDKSTGERDVKKIIEPIIELIMGTQIDPAVGLYNIVGGGSEEGIENDVYDLIGVSSSYRPSGNAGSGTAKPPKKKSMSKSDLKKFDREIYDEIYGDDNDELKEIRKELREMTRE
tara:strand:- start:772 stop:6162 length:5391 start_codon:yes stop_codon:yes gene_type:complete